MGISENVYMILCTVNETGRTFYIKSGRGRGTPFTTTNISYARGELTKYNKYNTDNYYTYRLVKVTQVEETC